MHKKLSPQAVQEAGKLLFPELGKEQAASLLLHYFFTREKAAFLLGISQKGYKSHLFRAQKHLKDKLKTDDIEPFIVARLAKIAIIFKHMFK
ncbi:hypothetical protein [Vibrio maritimus]|uniref:hypothetical protein n=1 Tax=Vibrio maritimus TaxID=990268 RepID=UPI001F273F97|nr:hypothetical protein [Vibrio maritimus]